MSVSIILVFCGMACQADRCRCQPGQGILGRIAFCYNQGNAHHFGNHFTGEKP